MKNAGVRAGELFKSGYFCAESVLMAVAEHRGIESAVIPRIATGFCGGMSRTSGLCGALTGGVMALSLLFGRDRPDDSRDTNYALVVRYKRAFEERFGSTMCSDLLGCDLATEEGSRIFEEKKLIDKVCAKVTEEAAGLVMEIVEKEAHHPRDPGDRKG
jgi:C_GCAxxG_C_C family probable redox protein